MDYQPLLDRISKLESSNSTTKTETKHGSISAGAEAILEKLYWEMIMNRCIIHCIHPDVFS